MKKFTAIFICATFCLSFFAGCASSQEKTAYDLYLNMQKALDNVKSIDMDMALAMEFTINTEPTDYSSGENKMTYNINGNLKQVKTDSGDFDMAMEFERKDSYSTSGLNPHSNNIGFASYYTGGIYYEALTVLGQKGPGTKKPMTVEEVMRQIETDEIKPLDFPETAIKESEITDLNDGSKKTEFILNGEFMTEQLLEKMRYAYPSPELKNAALTFNDFICEIVIDKDNIMKSYKMICDVTVTAHGEDGNMKMEISMTVNSYNDVIINFPADLDSYTD